MHVELLHSVTSLAVQRIRAPDDSRWSRLKATIGTALQAAVHVEIGHDGVALVAIRRHDGDDAGAATQHILAVLGERGYRQNDAEYISSMDFQLESAGDSAGVVPPIPLWELPVDHRVALMMREVDLSVVVNPSVWREAFVAAGLDFTERDRAWVVSVDGRSALFPSYVAAKLHNALLVGVSPAEIAQGALGALKSDGLAGA